MNYTHHSLNCIGRAPASIIFGSTTQILDLYVIEGNYDSLFGREWIAHFSQEFNWSKIFQPLLINSLSTNSKCIDAYDKESLEILLSKYNDVFSETAGNLIGPAQRLK